MINDFPFSHPLRNTTFPRQRFFSPSPRLIPCHAKVRYRAPIPPLVACSSVGLTPRAAAAVRRLLCLPSTPSRRQAALKDVAARDVAAGVIINWN